MLISFTGAQSTGKTTLLNELKKNEKLYKRFKFVDEITRSVQKRGYPINENSCDATQREIMRVHLNNIFLEDAIMDRCSIDCLIYTVYLFGTNKVSKDTMEVIRTSNNACVGHYDLIFYIEPEFSVVDDGVRSTNVDFRDTIADLFKVYIQDIKNDKTKVVKVTGSVEQRLEIIYNTLKEEGIEC